LNRPPQLEAPYEETTLQPALAVNRTLEDIRKILVELRDTAGVKAPGWDNLEQLKDIGEFTACQGVRVHDNTSKGIKAIWLFGCKLSGAPFFVALNTLFPLLRSLHSLSLYYR
jgi:hypothetical protein